MENNAPSFLVVPSKDRPPEGYKLSTLSQAKENIESMRRAYESSKAFGEKESVRLKNGLLEHEENIELLMERRYQEGLEYKLVSNSKMGKELPKEDCLVALAYAVENDDVEVVKEVVECAGPDILKTRFASVGSGTILHMCTHWSSVNTLDMVLAVYPPECSDLFSVDDDGETALHNLPNCWSIEKSYLDCKKAALLLLRFDAVNPNKLLGVQSNRPYQMTALCKALVFEMRHVCEALLDAAACTIEKLREDEKSQKCATEEREDQTSQKSSATEESTWLSLEACGESIAAVYKDVHDDDDEEDDGAFCSTALHLAIGRGYADIAAKILKHPGAESLNLSSLTDSDDNTPLHVAAMVGDSETCATLLNNGTLEPDKARSGGVQSLNKRGETPLHIASAQGNPEVCKKLLECQAPLLVRDVEGRYPLTNALMKGHLEVVKMLLNACLHSASKSKGHGKSKAINSKDIINGRLEFGFTPLHVAAAICSLNHVRKLIEAGADIDCISDEYYVTPLHLAVEEGSSISNETSTADEKSSASTEDESRSSNIVKKSSEITKEANSPRKLSSETAEVNIVTDAESSNSTVRESSEATKEANNPRKDKENITSAVIKESSSEITEANNPRIEGGEITNKQVEKVCDVVSLFLNAGARVDLQDYMGETPLHNAAQCHYDVLRTLLLKAKHGHNFKNSKEQWICMCNFAGQTALHQLAARVDDPLIKRSVGFLLSQTSSPNDLLRIRDTDKMTALDLAAQNAKYKSRLIKKMLKAEGIDPLTKGFLVWRLREHGHNTDADKYGSVGESQTSLLEAAVKERDVDIARELVNTGADVTALHYDKQIWLADNLCKVASDQPTLEDSLGRRELVQAVATLLLNPYTGTPITIGIFGSWGAGKSSFMLQVEEAMLSMNVKEIFQKAPCSSSFTKFSRGGNCLRSMVLRALKQRMTKAKKFKQKAYGESLNDDDIIYTFPMELQTKYRQLFRSLALTDRSKLVQSSVRAWYKGVAPHHDASFIAYTPAVLTMHYNAWQYDNKIEASAGLVIEISKQLESFMTPPQWLRMCWKYSWKNHPKEILAHFILPTLIIVFVVCVLLSLWEFVPIATKYKAISLPTGIVSVMLPIIKACLTAIRPVTGKMLDRTKSFDHQSMLGYQHQVIEDINFLKNHLCEDAHFGWIVLSILCRPFMSNRYFMEGTWIWRQHPFLSNFRMVVFIDDLDRCDEKIILELLRAINLILGSCGINVVIGVDKDMLQLAITREFLKDSSDNIFDFWVDSKVSSQETNAQVLENVDGKPTLEPEDSKNEEKGKMNANVDKHLFISEFANRYLQKIIHLPIQMPEPSKQHLKKFLECHVGQRFASPKKKQKDESTIKNQEDKQGKIEDKSNGRKHEFEIAIVGENTKDEKKPIKNDGFSQREVSAKGQKVHVNKEEDPESDDGAIKRQNKCLLIKKKKKKEEEEGPENDDGAIEPIVYRLLVANYTPLEKDMLIYLCQFTTKEKNLPREWKRFLNYHRLAWTILSNDCTMKEDKFKGWQRGLIIWIFICWNWRPQMDAIFKNWHEITSKKSKRPAKLQLQDANKDGGTGLKLLDIIGTYIDSMKGNTLETTSKNMGKQEDEVVSKAWNELRTMIKDKNDIPLKFVGKFQQFRFYCVLNHLEINE